MRRLFPLLLLLTFTGCAERWHCDRCGSIGADHYPLILEMGSLYVAPDGYEYHVWINPEGVPILCGPADWDEP